MSSACVCHTDEYCFYCDIYAPLEEKYEDERALNEAIGVEREEWVKERKRLRAIAELAVKALERIDSIRETYPVGFDYHHAMEGFEKAERLALMALDEIKRISAEGARE